MSDGTKIEWTDATWNPIRARDRETGKVGWFCTRASPGCANCYAEPINRRLGTGVDYKPGNLDRIEVFLDEAALLKPLSWRRPRMIFAGSMTDLFGDFVRDEWLDRIFAVAALCPQHVIQVLTKRPERMRAYLAHPATARAVWELACNMVVEHGFGVVLLAHPSHASIAPAGRHVYVGRWPLRNVWLGVSVEDQRRADERIPVLLDTPAAVRWISAEPLLGGMDLQRVRRFDAAPKEFIDALTGRFWTDQAGLPNPDTSWAWPGRLPLDDHGIEVHNRRLDWVVAGGESGPGARPMHPDWARSLRDQCAATGAAFNFKQHGAWAALQSNDGEWPVDAGAFIRLRPDGKRAADGWPMQMVGKKAAGRLLDGVTHDGYPEAQR